MNATLGPVEVRSAVIEEVSYPERTIDLIVVPYDEWGAVEYRGRIIEESFAPGSFGAVRKRARKFLVNMEHDPDRWVGTVLDLNADNEVGLRSKVKIRRTPEGDQALTDAADGFLGASVGFACAPDHFTWVTENRRRINFAYLDHVGLTSQPTYLGAELLEVRSSGLTPRVVPPETSPTPILDKVLAEMREAGYIRR